MYLSSAMEKTNTRNITNEVTAVIVNYNTPALLEVAVSSLRRWYPFIHFILIDNGSDIESLQHLDKYKIEFPGTIEVILNKGNMHHGPAMDQGIRLAVTPFVFILDSDCEILQGGLIEQMVALLRQSPSRYIAGKVISMNKRGFDTELNAPGSILYVRPFCMMVKRDIYLPLPPFQLHGAPCLTNMRSAVEKGFELVHFPVEEYVRHEGRGTASQFGYQLGFKGKLNHLLNKMGL